MLKIHDGQKLVLALLLIFLPLVDSLYPVIGLGLRWHSPLFMELFNNWFMLAKIISVAIGLRLFSKASFSRLPEMLSGDTTQVGRFVAIQKTIVSSVVWLVSIVHVLIITLVLLLSVTLGRDVEYIHYEQRIGDRQFYVHTIDPGAMGKAFHNVGLKCSLPFGRFKIVHLGRTDYIGSLELVIENELLYVKDRLDTNLKNGHRINLTEASCTTN